MKQKKLQVFISSTFEDLKEERQAAVEAVLSSGHIPAGMELFSAGDESQMKVIQRWIEESDVYLLILGGRYGSIEPESGISYTELEYKYAVNLGMPLFAVVIKETALEQKIKSLGSSVIEKENFQLLEEFKKNVLLKMVKFFDDVRDIKLAVHETMSEFNRRKDLIGWVRSDKLNTDNLLEELARLTKENAEMRKSLNSVNDLPLTFNGLTFEEVLLLLKSNEFDVKKADKNEIIIEITNTRKHFKDKKTNLLHFFWTYKDAFAQKAKYSFLKSLNDEIELLENFGLLRYQQSDGSLTFTPEGRKFYLKLLTKHTTK